MLLPAPGRPTAVDGVVCEDGSRFRGRAVVLAAGALHSPRLLQGYFEGTRCHRLTTEGIFVLQCGDPSATGMGGPGYSFADELSGTEQYSAGTVAMANAGPNTNGSQFFIVFQDSMLPPAYTVFGHLDAASLKVVQKIGKVPTANRGFHQNVPVEPVVVESARVIESAAPARKAGK